MCSFRNATFEKRRTRAVPRSSGLTARRSFTGSFSLSSGCGLARVVCPPPPFGLSFVSAPTRAKVTSSLSDVEMYLNINTLENKRRASEDVGLNRSYSAERAAARSRRGTRLVRSARAVKSCSERSYSPRRIKVVTRPYPRCWWWWWYAVRPLSL